MDFSKILNVRVLIWTVLILIQISSFTLFALLCYTLSSYGEKGCMVRLNDELLAYLPLLLKPGKGLGYDAFYLPEDRAGTISFTAGETIVLNCPGSKVQLGETATDVSVAEAKCSSGPNFNVLGETVPFNQLKCTNHPKNVARYSGKACLKTYKEIEIGFDLDDGRFLKFITICYDYDGQNSLYSQYDLIHNIEGYQAGYPRNDFLEGNGFYHLGKQKLDKLYSRDVQRVNINKALGLNVEDFTYIHEKDNYFLSHGHLTAKADFVYGSQHRFTFYYVNVAPQWQTFNGGNWKTLEENVRDFAASQKLDLVVYTGTSGVSTLPHSSTGKPVPLYLYQYGNEKGVPVPEVYWKVIYDPNTKKGTAFIGINNPYKQVAGSDIFCKDICSQISWLTVTVTDNKLGYTFCCAVPDFRKTMDTLPDFTVSGVLK